MNTVRAAVIPRPGAQVELRSFAMPELEPDSGWLEVLYSEVCGTDVHLQQGLLQGVPYPLIPGHVTVGRLARTRGVLRDVDGARLEEGEPVTFLDVHRTCHACWYCLVAKASTRCPSRKVYGITYGAEDGLLGGWAEGLYLKPGTRVIPLRGADPRTLLLGGCGLPTALHAMERANIRLGDSVLVLGAGPVALSALILSRRSGALRTLVIGAPEARLACANDLGAAAALDFRSASRAERAEWVRARTGGRGADVVIEATGQPEAVVDAMRCARDGGTVVVVGQYTDHGETSFNPHTDLNRKHLDVRGCWGSDYSHFHRAVALLGVPELAAEWRRIPAEEFGLEQVGEALAAVAAGSVVKALVRPY